MLNQLELNVANSQSDQNVFVVDSNLCVKILGHLFYTFMDGPSHWDDVPQRISFECVLR